LLGEGRFEEIERAVEEQHHIDNPSTFSASHASEYRPINCKYCDKTVGNLESHLKDNWKCIAKRISSNTISIGSDDEFNDAKLEWGMTVMLKPIHFDKHPTLIKKLIKLGGRGTAHTSSKDGDFMFKHRYVDNTGRRLILPANYFVRVTDNTQSIGVQ
jgi:hypothetical protein